MKLHAVSCPTMFLRPSLSKKQSSRVHWAFEGGVVLTYNINPSSFARRPRADSPLKQILPRADPPPDGYLYGLIAQ
ncbi:hypothetical protein OIU77_012027 [Salix suchowensis]|uniref:Uncharacterized protein n=1 Tax=Salix suchowensis TaxID=1278906 RepID=A0ABQ9A2Y4_9ROSI|nr:hypothetical protein OIU77_012027 [Salix suchowensis]